MEKKFISHSAEETISFGEKLVKTLKDGSVVLLTGDLGAGKTTMVKGFAKGLNINEVVISPTFNIMKLYLSGDRTLVHIDAYRLEDQNLDIGLDEYIGYEKGITVIEWPMFIKPLLPENCIEIKISNINESERMVEVKGVNF